MLTFGASAGRHGGGGPGEDDMTTTSKQAPAQSWASRLIDIVEMCASVAAILVVLFAWTEPEMALAGIYWLLGGA